jgi:hypothetical protein
VTRIALASLVMAVSAACSQPAPVSSSNTSSRPAGPKAETPPDAHAGSSGVARVPGDSGPLMDPIAMIGTWSFDRTCASEDGMTLAADGTAGTDQGPGMWAVDAEQRLVIIVREQEMGKAEDKLAERIVWRFTPSKIVDDDLVGTLEPRRMGEKSIAVNARRCPT